MMFKIEDRLVGGERCYLIAEVAQGHDGSLGMASCLYRRCCLGWSRRDQVSDPYRGL